MRSKTEVVWSAAIREAIEPVASWFDVDGEEGEPMELVEAVKQIASTLAEERQHSLAMLAALRRQQANIKRWLATGVPASPEESESISDQIDDAVKLGSCSGFFLGWDNSEPPQFWVWRGEPGDETAEAWQRVQF
jgi:hypothetical protein